MRFVEMVLHTLFSTAAPAAVHRAVRRLLGHEAVRRGPVRHWVPLQAFGTFDERTR
jgi:hypothetical protein